LALSTLQSIHCAGILQGDIRPENILIGESGITIIDFGHSELCDNEQAKKKELAQLRYFFGLAGESH
jgi:serine/threonine protein kinase